ncbi:uroporphyrinogen-III synthase-like [Ostrinia furnacalis]|uniref:uroporphyrinogen-III synthase-like n=1 Tax=Ostrinia furnacalis TaxID=93504 RepID=UPI00103A9342|nr:uroporphyrinogen-III synthase-like [Ostrinia furnacalis]
MREVTMKKAILFKSASDDYVKAFTDCNYEVIFVEPLQFKYINTEELKEKLQQKYDGLILTSPRAIEAVSKCWDPSKFVSWNARKTYTVGDVSRQKITLMLGLEALGATSGNAENLAKIICNENPKSSKFLFPCGNLRSETLPNTLESAELSVDAVVAYETVENENLQQELVELNESEEEPYCLVFFSPSGCEYVHRRLKTFSNKLSSIPHFAIGNSTAHKIENFGVDIAGVAARPKPDSVVEAVQNYFTTLTEGR